MSLPLVIYSSFLLLNIDFKVCIPSNGLKSSLAGGNNIAEFIRGQVTPITFQLTPGVQNELAENSCGISLRVRLHGPFDSYPAQVYFLVRFLGDLDSYISPC